MLTLTLLYILFLLFDNLVFESFWMNVLFLICECIPYIFNFTRFFLLLFFNLLKELG